MHSDVVGVEAGETAHGVWHTAYWSWREAIQ
jgi:hypothetical protein